MYKTLTATLILGALSLSQPLLAHTDGAYSHSSGAVASNPTWMALVDGDTKFSALNLPGTHDTMSTKSGDIWQNQTMTLREQLDSGLRVFDMRTRHINDGFTMHHGAIELSTKFEDVLTDINSFLAANPSETVAFRLRSEHTAKNNTRSYEETFKAYMAWKGAKRYTGSSNNPTLDQIRGKFVILQEFSGADYGISYGSIDKQDDYSMTTNWDLYKKWTAVKGHMEKSEHGSRDTMYMNYLSASGGSFPYFVASGHSSNGTSAPRLSTGFTTPGWNSSYPDFPRTTCFIGICTISFEGTNSLTANYITNGNSKFVGMVMADFPGKKLIESIINLNNLSVSNMRLNQFVSGQTYNFKLQTKAVGGEYCRLEWDGSLSGHERNAKFDCSSSGDPMTFVPTAAPWINSNGYHATRGYIMTMGGTCGLEWDGSLSGGERNAKFDCGSGKDEVYITSHADGKLSNIIITSVDIAGYSNDTCGLQWNGGSKDGNERNAKFDCDPAWDPMSMIDVKK